MSKLDKAVTSFGEKLEAKKTGMLHEVLRAVRLHPFLYIFFFPLSEMGAWASRVCLPWFVLGVCAGPECQAPSGPKVWTQVRHKVKAAEVKPPQPAGSKKGGMWVVSTRGRMSSHLLEYQNKAPLIVCLKQPKFHFHFLTFCRLDVWGQGVGLISSKVSLLGFHWPSSPYVFTRSVLCICVLISSYKNTS